VLEDAYQRLKAMRGQADLADDRLSHYWMKKARVASVEMPRDVAGLLWLKALTMHNQAEAMLQAQRVWSGSLAQVVMTFRTGAPDTSVDSPGSGTVVAMSKDGQWLVTGSGEGEAQIWDAHSGQPQGQPMWHRAAINHVSFSPDGRQVVTASWDNTARLWESPSGLPLGKPLQHESVVYHAKFSPDGRQVVTATDQTLTWWQPEADGSHRPLATVWANGGKWRSSPRLLSPDGKRLRILDPWTGDTALLRDLVLDEAEEGLPPLPAPAAQMLEDYLIRFSLKFDQTPDGKPKPNLVPRYPIPTRPKDPEERPK
jgi:WD domain, G-beta repeat